jgi:DnaJ-class molecular chaperone
MTTMVCPNCCETGKWNGRTCEVCKGKRRVLFARFIAIRCQCNSPSCERWQVHGIAGEAKFDLYEASAVARVLNMINVHEDKLARSLMEALIHQRLKDMPE